jgi:transcriptional regulator with XRE-family HTH domain
MRAEIDRAAFAKRMRQAIEEKGISHIEAARSLSLPQPQLSRYLNGQVPDPTTLLKMANWIGCTMEWLLTGQMRAASGMKGTQARMDPLLRQISLAWVELDEVSKGKLYDLVMHLRNDSREHKATIEYLDLVQDMLALQSGTVSLQVKRRKRASIMAKLAQQLQLDRSIRPLG